MNYNLVNRLNLRLQEMAQSRKRYSEEYVLLKECRDVLLHPYDIPLNKNKCVAWRFWVTDHPTYRPFWTGWIVHQEEAISLINRGFKYECAYAEAEEPV